MERYIHAHHELEEERLLFPVVDRRSDMKNVVNTLRAQHSAARELTAVIGDNAVVQNLDNEKHRAELLRAMEDFNNMYEPHGSFEDTVVYPQFR